MVTDPVVGQNSDSAERLEVFVVGVDNGLWHIFMIPISINYRYRYILKRI